MTALITMGAYFNSYFSK